MRIRSLLATAALTALACTTVSATRPAPAGVPDAVAFGELHGYAQGLADAGQFSGVVLVAHGGELKFLRAYGPIDPGDTRDDAPRITPDTRFNVASVGKMFTAVAVLQQVAAGRLTLDTPVGDVLRDYPNATFARTVTVRHLLTHTAGAGDLDLFGADKAELRARTRTVAQMVALHADRAPAFTPGTNQQYGNFGHVVLGRMVEVLSGEGFEAYLQRHVFGPAGMTRTGFTDCTDPAPDLAVSYATVDGKQVRNCATQPARGFPAGGQMSTARDLLAFVRALQDGTLLPPALFAEATRTHHLFMGLGFFATGYGEGVPAREFRWGHGGSTDGVCTDVRTYPTTGETLIVLANREPPVCFGVANFLHRRLDEREAGGG